MLFEYFGKGGGGHDGVVLEHDELFIQRYARLGGRVSEGGGEGEGEGEGEGG